MISIFRITVPLSTFLSCDNVTPDVSIICMDCNSPPNIKNSNKCENVNIFLVHNNQHHARISRSDELEPVVWKNIRQDARNQRKSVDVRIVVTHDLYGNDWYN